MLSSKISLMIDAVCKEQGIDYCSPNPHLQTFCEDAQRLGEIYMSLKIILGDLKDIEERHDIKSLNKKIEEIIIILEDVDHALIRLAKEFKERQDNEKSR